MKKKKVEGFKKKKKRKNKSKNRASKQMFKTD